MLKIYKCEHCGNIAVRLVDKSFSLNCCGEKMVEMEPNTVDAATEKHVPEVSMEGEHITARVGSVEHPMLEEHFIQFILLETEKGFQVKKLNPGEAPEATFAAVDGAPIAVYEYCNLHGLWKKDL